MPITNVQFPEDDGNDIPSVKDDLIQRLGEVDAFVLFDEIDERIMGEYYAELLRKNLIENPREDVICIRLDSKDREVRLFGYMRHDEIYVAHSLVKKRHTRTPPEEIDLAEQKIKLLIKDYGH